MRFSALCSSCSSLAIRRFLNGLTVGLQRQVGKLKPQVGSAVLQGWVAVGFEPHGQS